MRAFESDYNEVEASIYVLLGGGECVHVFNRAGTYNAALESVIMQERPKNVYSK